MSGFRLSRCPVCLSDAQKLNLGNGKEKWDCSLCGTYTCTGSFAAMAAMDDVEEGESQNRLFLGENGTRSRSDLTAWLRENTGNDFVLTNWFFQTNSNDPIRGSFENARAQVTTFHDRVNKLLLFLENKSSYAGVLIEYSLEWIPRAWANNTVELKEIISYLERMGGIQSEGLGFHRIAPNGWAHLEELKKTNLTSTQAFVAMRFKDPMFEVYQKAIAPAIRDAGYKPFLMGSEHHNNMIDNEIIAQIRRSKFVVADLTFQNRGVYFEAGFAKGLNREVFWTKNDEDEAQTHFDTRQFNQTRWTMDNLPKFRKDLSNAIEAILGRGPEKRPKEEKDA